MDVAGGKAGAGTGWRRDSNTFSLPALPRCHRLCRYVSQTLPRAIENRAQVDPRGGVAYSLPMIHSTNSRPSGRSWRDYIRTGSSGRELERELRHTLRSLSWTRWAIWTVTRVLVPLLVITACPAFSGWLVRAVTSLFGYESGFIGWHLALVLVVWYGSARLLFWLHLRLEYLLLNLPVGWWRESAEP
jgi:hypothetical protein